VPVEQHIHELPVSWKEWSVDCDDAGFRVLAIGGELPHAPGAVVLDGDSR
jgi:hypothetical protein